MAEGERRALIVDDTSVMRMILSKIMREHRYDVTEATNGAEAIQTYFRWKPDIVIMDLTMDGIDGTTCSSSAPRATSPNRSRRTS